MHILCLWLTKVFVFTILLVGGVLLFPDGWGLAATWSGLPSSNSSTWWCPLAGPMAGLCPGHCVICSRWQSFHHCRDDIWNICSSQGTWLLIVHCSGASLTTLSSLSWSHCLLRLGCFLHMQLVPWFGPSLWRHHYGDYSLGRLNLIVTRGYPNNGCCHGLLHMRQCSYWCHTILNIVSYFPLPVATVSVNINFV